MRKLTLGEWVQVAELVAAVGVIVSLLLLVYSLERNTAALQGGTEDALFESLTAFSSRMVDDPALEERPVGGALAPIVTGRKWQIAAEATPTITWPKE